MRGALWASPMPGTIIRIIPADAGSTTFWHSAAHHGWDHPRGCGEHMSWSMSSPCSLGSSPRMRGALDGPVQGVGLNRIIPADAGSTRVKDTLSDLVEDHPRGCGEHQHAQTIFIIVYGSSPRMRGAPGPWPWNIIRRRIIPADAGSTDHWPWSWIQNQDHPRGCGEHTKGCPSTMLTKGSSPRMRGAPYGLSDNRIYRGIIPADAGSTSPTIGTVRSSRDHPRGCGEHCLPYAGDQTMMGSSPRMRGALGIDIPGSLRGRIIPADAGSTLFF